MAMGSGIDVVFAFMSDDFFSNVPVRRGPAHSPPSATDPHDDFAHAISLRFGSADIRTPRLLPGDFSPHQPRPPVHTPPLPLPPPSSPPQSFAAVPPSALAHTADPHILILDIRPHAAHAAARITHALSLSVPTTLLKRPLFSLAKISQMLPSPSSRARFAEWPSASSILVYDSDSASSPDNSIIAGLLRKFRTEGFTGDLGWIRGGFQAVWKEARELTTTEQPVQEEDDPDAASSSGALRTTHLPKAAFSLSSTTAAPLQQLGAFPVPHALPNTPAPSASRAANPFFDTIRQNVELSHGITERIPLRLPRRVRRRIHDLPFRWLQDIARRSAVRHSSASRHPGLDSFESGSESSDDPHTSDPDENDPNVEEGTEVLAMQFYRIELAEQRRLRSIMEHHTKESEFSGLASAVKSRRTLDQGGMSVSADRERGGVTVRTGSKSMPGTPHPNSFPYSITAGVEKGTKNRYTHIWPFEHARVRLHDGRHQGSHPGRRDKGKGSERGRNARARSGNESRKSEEQALEQGNQRRNRSSPAFDKSQDQEAAEDPSLSKHLFYFEAQSTTGRAGMGSETDLVRSTLSSSPGVPEVKIEYDITDQDIRMSEPPTPATALPLITPPFYTPMEIPSTSTSMRAWPPQYLFSPPGAAGAGGGPGGALSVPPTSGLPSPEPLPPLPLRLPNRSRSLLPSIGEQPRTSESLSPVVPLGVFVEKVVTIGEIENVAGTKRDPRREPSPVDDYVNASYVQPLGTRKHYIATQGPLPSTYVDFWTLVWEQNVHVIAMLTREVENSMVKCGSYWTDAAYGPLRLELLSTSRPMPPSTNLTSMDISKQGFFTIREPQAKTSGATRDQPALITRIFALSNTSYPGVPPRKITHLQYLDWSDMNVPDDPRGVLDLVNKLERAVAESTPGPSPSGSLSPGSGSSSLSGSPSPDVGPDQKEYDTSLLSPTSASTTPGRGRKRRGNGWRHPELDPKTGIATFALGKTAPVLLHCSAGVGRTGGFIAVDAVLDGIRRELRRNMEERRSKKVGVGVSMGVRAHVNDREASGEVSVESTEAGANSAGSGREESVSAESAHMDIDEPSASEADDAGKTRNLPNMVNTVPIHVSAGDRTKGNRRCCYGKDLSGKKQFSSSESLVVHVPYAGTNVPEDTNVADIDIGNPKEAVWQSASTRQWVKHQTHTHAEGSNLLQTPPPPPSSRERSPGSTSNSSGASAINSREDSMSGSASAHASESASGSGSGNRSGRKSDMESASGSGTGSGGPPLSSVSKLGSGSVSLSNSGSGTGSGSRFGSSLLHARLRDSSVTSVSAESTDSLLPEQERKANVPLHRPLAIHTSSSSDMETDYLPRPISVPLQSAQSNTESPQSAIHSRHYKPMLGSSPVARISSPILPSIPAQRGISFFGGTPADSFVSRPGSDLGSDELAGSLQEIENGESADVEESGKNSQIASDESEEPAIPTKPRSNLRLDTKLGSLKVSEALHSSGCAKKLPFPSGATKSKERATIPRVSGVPDVSALPQTPPVAGAPASERNQHATEYPVIDYKLPRELHSDLSPPLISSFIEPICMVIQDMREQRMSLCQSLRQYVFVHAAIIEGALRIVDEERELWGYGGTSDDASSAEGEPMVDVGKGGGRSSHSEGTKTWYRGADKPLVALRTPEPVHGSISHRSRSLHMVAQSSNHRYLEGNSTGGQAQITSAPSSGVSSPPKGKRGPSPTELLREDKSGALSSNKRPSIHRKTRSQENPFSLESSNSPVVRPGDNGGGPNDAVALSGTRTVSGRPAAPEQGGPTSGIAR